MFEISLSLDAEGEAPCLHFTSKNHCNLKQEKAFEIYLILNVDG
jgi:hypothetical protein